MLLSVGCACVRVEGKAVPWKRSPPLILFLPFDFLLLLLLAKRHKSVRSFVLFLSQCAQLVEPSLPLPLLKGKIYERIAAKEEVIKIASADADEHFLRSYSTTTTKPKRS